jgi:hypothetical protein
MKGQFKLKQAFTSAGDKKAPLGFIAWIQPHNETLQVHLTALCTFNTVLKSSRLARDLRAH